MKIDFEIMDTEGRIRVEGSVDMKMAAFTDSDSPTGKQTQILLPVEVELKPGETLTVQA